MSTVLSFPMLSCPLCVSGLFTQLFLNPPHQDIPSALREAKVIGQNVLERKQEPTEEPRTVLLNGLLQGGQLSGDMLTALGRRRGHCWTRSAAAEPGRLRCYGRSKKQSFYPAEDVSSV